MAKKTKSVVEVTKAINKKGKLKGKNKKETKTLKGICPHHKITKRGRIKPTIFINSDEYAICTLCKHRFPTRFLDDDQLDERIDAMEELNDMNKFAAVATNSGDSMSDYFSNMGAMFTTYKKNSKKLRAVGRKRDKIQKKKKQQRTGSSMYGSWGRK